MLNFVSVQKLLRPRSALVTWKAYIVFWIKLEFLVMVVCDKNSSWDGKIAERHQETSRLSPLRPRQSMDNITNISELSFIDTGPISTRWVRKLRSGAGDAQQRWSRIGVHFAKLWRDRGNDESDRQLGSKVATDWYSLNDIELCVYGFCVQRDSIRDCTRWGLRGCCRMN